MTSLFLLWALTVSAFRQAFSQGFTKNEIGGVCGKICVQLQAVMESVFGQALDLYDKYQ